MAQGKDQGGREMNATVKVLLIEDDRDDARLVSDLLADAKRARFIVDTALTPKRSS